MAVQSWKEWIPIKKKMPKSRCSQNLGNLFAKHFEEWVAFFGKLPRRRPVTVLKMNSFRDISHNFRLDLNQHCTPFWNFQKTYFTEILLLMIQMQGYYVMACIMWFCMHVETVERPCKLTHPKALWMIFHQIRVKCHKGRCKLILFLA